MPIKFFIDTHIDKAVAVQGRKRGIDVVRCEEVGMADAVDSELLKYAVREGRTMVSADADFARLHAEWLANGWQHSGIIRVLPQHKDDIGGIVDMLEFLHEAIAGEAADLEKDVYNTLRFF